MLAMGRKDPEMLKAFLSTAPKIAAVTSTAKTPEKPSESSAYARAQKLAADLRVTHPELSAEQALARVVLDKPELHAEIEAERVANLPKK
jgi:hypothetical protein